jgi:hypothetical protein
MTVSTVNGSSSRAQQLPPIALFVIGSVCLIVWLGGTSVQVVTSESWMLHAPSMLNGLSPFTAYIQMWHFIQGQLPSTLTIPFIFAWGVQAASLLASIGLELPHDPAWRFYLSIAAFILLIGVNSSGDFQSAAQYGGWGQLGFTVAVLFVTFLVGFCAILAIARAIRLMRAGSSAF